MLTPSDKTHQFTTKIEAKQRELEPWTAKISEKQSLIDVATSERDLLAQKATGAQSSIEDAAAAIDALKDSDATKVCDLDICEISRLITPAC